MAPARLSRFEATALVLALGGLLVRLVQATAIVDDSAWYAVMGRSFDLHGEFLIPWSNGVYTHHFPPLFPLVLALFFLPAGGSLAAMHAASWTCAALLVVVAFATTADLYGRKRGFAVAAIVATFPILLGFDQLALSESLVAALFALTIWAILRSLDRPAFIVLAGLFAGLSYLAKASMGPFVLLAGAGGFAWRFYYARWAVLKDRHYLAGAAVFALVASPWVARNWIRFGSLDSQPHATESVRILFAERPWWIFLAQALLTAVVALVVFALPFLGSIRRSLSSLRDERTSALWMAVVTPTLVAVFFVAAFGAAEGLRILFVNLVDRYVVTCIVPLLWLALRDADVDEPRADVENPEVPRRERILRWSGLALLALTLALRPTTSVLTTARILVLFGGCLAAYVLLFVARGYHWSSSARTREGATKWRAQVEPPVVGAPLLAFPLLLFAFVLDSRQVLLIGAGAALLMATTRGRVVALCVAVLAASLAGSGIALPVGEVAHDVNALAKDGDSVAVKPDGEKFVAPFLDERLRMTAHDGNATWLVELPARDRVAPEGYHLVKAYEATHGYGPGTIASRAIEGWITGDVITPGFPPTAYLYERNATAPAPSPP